MWIALHGLMSAFMSADIDKFLFFTNYIIFLDHVAKISYLGEFLAIVQIYVLNYYLTIILFILGTIKN